MTYASQNREWLSPLIRHIADEMGLRDYQVRLADEAPDEDCAGQCQVSYGRKSIRIRLAEPEDRESLVSTIIHELLHAYVAPLDWLKNGLAGPLGSNAFMIYENSHEDVTEMMIDAIATAWARHIPTEVPTP